MAGIVASKDERTGISAQFGHLSPFPNTNALPGVLTPPEAARTVPHRVEGGVRDL